MQHQDNSLGFVGLLKSFTKPFWLASAMELFERWAWYGLFAVLALYLTGSTDEGALGFSHIERGEIMAYVTAILYFLPIITGAISDKIGYKLSLIIAYVLLAVGYFFMGRVTSYSAVFLMFLVVALGAAMFKPVASAIVTKSTDKTNSSFGFGVFYMMVNIGGFFGPLFSAKLRDAYGWNIVFLMATSAILVNLIIVLFFFKEPNREPVTETLGETLKRSFKNIWEALSDMRLTFLLIIMVGFWLMFNQLFYTLPVFIEEWIDTRPFYEAFHKILPPIADFLKNKDGSINPEMIVNLDAFFIIILQMIISMIILKWKPINAMMTGIFIAIIGIALSFYTNNSLYTVLGILIFAIGEMTSNPKFSDYIAKISPKGKEALYMGTYFLPIAAANLLTKWITGDLYEKYSDKVEIIRRELSARNIQLPEITKEYTKNDFYHDAADKLQMSMDQMTNYMWDTYHPGNIWYVIAGIGFLTIVGLLVYNTVINRMERRST